MGFSANMSDASGGEGESVLVCIRIFEGILASDVSLSYLIGAPREDNVEQDDLAPDTAIGQFSLLWLYSGTSLIRTPMTYIQWNLSNQDTNGAEEVSLLVRCPHFRG